MPFKILVVDDKIDDPSEEISELPELLRRAGYEVETTADENKAWNLVWEYLPDLIVLDIAFGDDLTYGIELCRAIRLDGNETPIILVTAVRKETKTVLRGFEAGADDYVRRPQGNREILARIRANLPPEAVIVDGYLQVDLAGRRVWIQKNGNWQDIQLPPRLWKLLQTLVINARLIVPTTSIKDRVWDKAVDDNVLFKAVHDLRHKVEPDPSHPIYIEAVRGIGYRFNGTLVRASSVPPIDVSLKTRLMTHAEQAIDRLLVQGSAQADPRPGEIERLACATGQYLIERFTSVLVGELE